MKQATKRGENNLSRICKIELVSVDTGNVYSKNLSSAFVCRKSFTSDGRRDTDILRGDVSMCARNRARYAGTAANLKRIFKENAVT